MEWAKNFTVAGGLIVDLNGVLERELAGFRVIDLRFARVTDKEEVAMLQEALTDTKFTMVAEHLRTALRHLADRERPDFRNSIKESISAVESMAKFITAEKKASLDAALAVLERGGKIHPALKKGFSSLYGYTSDADGIRHGMMDASTLTHSDAKYFLLSCTSFTNYLKSKL